MNVPSLEDGNGEDWSPTNASSARIGEEVILKWDFQFQQLDISLFNEFIHTESLVKLMHLLYQKSFGSVISLCLGP